MAKIIKKCMIGIGIFLGIIFIFLIGVSLYLQTDNAQTLIQRTINELIPGSVSWEKSLFSLLKGEFTLQNVSLRGPLREEFAGLERLAAKVSWIMLLKGDLTFKELIIEKPWAVLRLEEKGNLNLIRAFVHSKAGGPREEEGSDKTKGTSLPINIVVSSFKLVNGVVSYEMAAKGLKIVAQDIYLSGDGNLLTQSVNIILQMGKGRIESSKVHLALAQCKIRAGLRNSQIDLHHLELNTASSRFIGSGKIRDVLDKALFDIALEAAVSLAEASNSLYFKPSLTGDVTVKAAVRGNLNNPEVDLRLDYSGGVISGNKVNRLDLDLTLKDLVVTVNNLALNIASGDISLQGDVDLHNAFAKGLLAPPRDLEAISYNISLKGEGIGLEDFPQAASRKLRGAVNSDISISGRGLSPSSLSAGIVLETDVKQLTASNLETPVDLHIKTKASFKEGVATINQMEVKSGLLTFHSHGRYDFASHHISASLVLEAPSLKDIFSPFGINGLYGACGIRGTVHGLPNKPSFDFALQGRQIRFKEVTLGNVLIHACLEQSGILRISQLLLENQGSVIRGRGYVKVFEDTFFDFDRRFPLNFSATLLDIEIKDFVEKELARGTFEGKVDLTGTPYSFQAKGSLRGKNISIERIRVGGFAAVFRFSEGRLLIEKMDVHNHRSMLNVSGAAQVFGQKTGQLLKDPTFTLKIEGDSIFIEDFVDSPKGKVSLAATLEGSVKNPKGMAALHGTNVDLGIQCFREVRLVCALEGQKVWLKPLQLVVAPGEFIEGIGWITLDKAYQIELVSKGVSLDNIDKIRQRKIGQGRILFNISGQGTFEDPQLKGEITIKNPRFKGKSFHDFQIQLDLRDQVAHVSGKLDFDLKGLYRLQTKEFSMSILLNRTDLEPYFDLMDQKHLSGTVTGKIEAAGNTADIRRIHGFADLSNGDLLFKEKEILNIQDFKATLKDGEISILSLSVFLLKEGRIDVKGNIKIHGSLSLRAESSMPLQVLSLLAPELPDLTGNVTLSAEVNGTWFHPDIQGEMELMHVSFTIPTIQQKIHNMRGKILITPQMVTIDTIEGQIDTGRFSVAGTLELDGIRPAAIQLAIDAQALPIRVPDTLDALLNAALQIQGTPDKLKIQGEAVILEGTYYKDVNLSLLQIVGEKKREEAPLPKEIRLPFLKDMSVDISIKRRNPFFIDNNLAYLDINPDLQLSGTLSNPIITGRATIESGTVTYRGRIFVVKKGVIDFSNPYKIEPTFDIEGEVQVRKWTIVLAISGPPDKLSFTLVSDPPEQDGDILSLLLFGKTTQELIEAEGGTTRSTKRMLAGILATTLEDDIKKTTGLDILEVQTQSEEDEQASDQVKVTIGKELSKRMTVKYAVESKDGELSQRAIAEYKLLESILLSGFQDDKGISGGEIFFRLEFR
jgi:translocation and assembly module TamB